MHIQLTSSSPRIHSHGDVISTPFSNSLRFDIRMTSVSLRCHCHTSVSLRLHSWIHFQSTSVSLSGQFVFTSISLPKSLRIDAGLASFSPPTQFWICFQFHLHFNLTSLFTSTPFQFDSWLHFVFTSFSLAKSLRFRICCAFESAPTPHWFRFKVYFDVIKVTTLSNSLPSHFGVTPTFISSSRRRRVRHDFEVTFKFNSISFRLRFGVDFASFQLSNQFDATSVARPIPLRFHFGLTFEFTST